MISNFTTQFTPNVRVPVTSNKQNKIDLFSVYDKCPKCAGLSMTVKCHSSGCITGKGARSTDYFCFLCGYKHSETE